MNLAKLTELTEEQSREYVESIVWKEGATCPHCESKNAYKNTGKSARKGLYDCGDCGKQYTVTVGTIMEGSHISIRKWAMAFHLLCSSKKGFSALQLQRELGLGSYRSALFMLHRIRLAMQESPVKEKLSGTVEVDEAYFHINEKKSGEKKKRGRGTEKAPVMVMVERNGKAICRTVTNVTGKTLKTAIKENVEKSATIMTDEWVSYKGVGKHFDGGHHVVNHGRKEYVRGYVFTNTAESYFAIMK